MSFDNEGAISRILIADDDAELLRTTALLLARPDRIILEAQDGESALETLQGSPIDVLILDLNMPRVDGFELLRQIATGPPVLIIYSAFELITQDEVQRMVGSKIFRSIRKPVAPQRLISAVESAIAQLHSSALAGR